MDPNSGSLTQITAMVSAMTEQDPQPWGTGVPPVLDDAQRQAMLSQAVAAAVGRGYRVESHAPFQAVVVTGHRPNHTLHAILTVFSCSLWGIVWIIVTATTKERRSVLTVDPYGNVLWQ